MNSFSCMCAPGYKGVNCSIEVDKCAVTPCQNNGTCTNEISDFTCWCLSGFKGEKNN